MFLETMAVIGTLKAQAMYLGVTAKKDVMIQWSNKRVFDVLSKTPIVKILKPTNYPFKQSA